MKANGMLWMLSMFASLMVGVSHAQMVRPPSFAGGVPGLVQLQAISMQRHQMRTLLYREALDELRKNPKAADVPECSPGSADKSVLCLRRPESIPESVPPAVAVAKEATAPPTPTVSVPASAAPAAAPVALVEKSPQVVTSAPLTAAVAAKPPPELVSVPAQPAVAEKQPPPQRRRLAVLVGNNGYTLPIPPLETPIADVNTIAEVLRSRFGFETRVLHNATKAQIVQAVNLVADEISPDDNVLLFYAGHGYLMDDTQMGFWIPVDASVKTAANWISNTDISKLLQAIRARQLILVSDSCFSGSLTKEQKLSAEATLKSDEILRRRSVLVLSSGGDEPVSDEGKEGHSIFAWNLIKTLDTAQGMTSGYKVYTNVHGQVKKDAAQEPQYGAVVSAGHMIGGEYLFEVR
ncbi:MAG: caspase family protein [Proteobacteria bacterium]|nr:caspase family protein [Pseudomonadota bacterium]